MKFKKKLLKLIRREYNINRKKYIYLLNFLKKYNKYFKKLTKKWGKDSFWWKKNFFLKKDFFFYKPLLNFNNFDLNKIFLLKKRQIKNNIKLYKLFFYVSKYYLYDINTIYKFKKQKKIISKFKFLNKSDKLDYINLKIDNFLLKRKLFLNSLQVKGKRLNKHLKRKWFKMIFKNEFSFEQTKNYNRLFLLKNLKKRAKIRKKFKKKIKTCLMILKHNNNNFFIILSDFKGKVIKYYWAGQFNETHSKKMKKSYYLVFPMFKFIKRKLKNLKITNLIIYIKSNISPHMYKLIQLLESNKIKIELIKFLKPIPHHFGQRKKKLRRL